MNLKLTRIKSAVFLSLFIISVICCSKPVQKKVLNIDPERQFIIAHAGGMIDNHIYTNSLEALDSSYSKGCKIFELDIMETSDGKLVAVHDWKEFKKMTNYQNGKTTNEPLSEKEFLNTKIYGKFSPMNMEMINNWFEKHSDAILVTDKLNEPQKMADPVNGFRFKDRCLMELFSWKAIDVANKVGITPMASQNLLFDYQKENKLMRFVKKRQLINTLDEKRVKYLCFSYRKIAKNEKFLKELKDKGFVSYIYHINYDQNVDEKFAYKNYLNIVSGMYADNLGLLQTIFHTGSK